MKNLFFIVTTCIFFSSCTGASDNAPVTSYHVLVEGNWQGTIDSNRIDLTFIETGFEDGVFVNGSAHIFTDTLVTFYQIGLGNHNSTDTVWFSLLRIPVVSTEDYHLTGTVSGKTIQGTFEQLDSKGKVIKTGMWQAHRTF